MQVFLKIDPKRLLIDSVCSTFSSHVNVCVDAFGKEDVCITVVLKEAVLCPIKSARIGFHA